MLVIHTPKLLQILTKISITLILVTSYSFAQTHEATSEIPYHDIRQQEHDPKIPGVLGLKLSKKANGFIFVYYGNDDKQVANYLVGLQKALEQGHEIKGFIHANPVKGNGNTFEIFAYGKMISDFQEIADNYTGDLIRQYIADADQFLVPKINKSKSENSSN